MKLFEKYLWKTFSRKLNRSETQECVKPKPLIHRCCLSAMIIILATHVSMASAAEPATSQSAKESGSEPVGLIGEWCYEKKRRVTRYTVKEDVLRIEGGRSGRIYEADLSCDDAYTECKANTIRGWGTPVTEILRLDGENMNLTRLWGGAWKDKPYNFTYTRCPKW